MEVLSTEENATQKWQVMKEEEKQRILGGDIQSPANQDDHLNLENCFKSFFEEKWRTDMEIIQ